MFSYFFAEAPVSKSGQGYSGGPRIQRQEQVIHLSPKKSSQVRLHTSYPSFLPPSVAHMTSVYTLAYVANCNPSRSNCCLKFNCHFGFPFVSCSRTARIPATPAVTRCPAQLPAGATATATSGTKWERAEALAATRVSRSPTDWAGEATCRGRLPTAASTPAPTGPRTTRTPTRTTAAPPPCWRRAEAGRAGRAGRAERAGRGWRPRGTAPRREAGGCWRGRRLRQSPRGLRRRGAWRGRAEAPLLISWLETAAPTV